MYSQWRVANQRLIELEDRPRDEGGDRDPGGVTTSATDLGLDWGGTGSAKCSRMTTSRSMSGIEIRTIGIFADGAGNCSLVRRSGLVSTCRSSTL